MHKNNLTASTGKVEEGCVYYFNTICKRRSKLVNTLDVNTYHLLTVNIITTMNTGTLGRPIICSFMLQLSRKKRLSQHIRKKYKRYHTDLKRKLYIKRSEDLLQQC
jgi:hypothetical protein